MSAVSHPTWAEHARALLDRSGHTRGGARDTVIDHLAEQRCAVTAQAIEDALRDGGRAVSRASIYRVLDLLQAYRLVQRLDVGHGSAMYELVDPAGDHHHHLLCERCGRVVPFDDQALERAIEAVSGRLDFRIDDHEVVLRGSCTRCRG
ncbi:MAG: Fur family transcriptional regulator, ferric uptake regulator [Thermoleophilaceae bacterium]|jgi:Fur family ferric uptake transcriptional regulator|nr:Fur family transcriptional regulator, ferric uptake regulator [Thermoleophilaceae bacterium]